eukprot:TRINITY_DN16392_c0_g1_i6.p1 TRINITY_DN16392_c0_g1~~TRINITY_DN16392_c0_g1_i6.p1  ORF type:complete len:592 (+),score=114.72 TRINITY_DN16392_c0_g1_i6:30-1778(+)
MDKRQECCFKEKCYRKNPHHFKEYSHSHLELLLLTFPDFQVDNDPGGIGIQNLREQLKIFADIEKTFTKCDETNDSNDKGKNQNGGAYSGNTNTSNNMSAETSNGTTHKRQSTPDNDEQRKRQKIEAKEEGGSSVGISRPGKSKVLQKIEDSAPFYYFLNKVKDNPDTHKSSHSIYMTDLLHPSLGNLKSSLQINFMVELDWLLMNYEVTKNSGKPLVILYGAEDPQLTADNLPGHVKAVRIKPKYPFGTHHTKMMVLVYEDESVRVAVHTSNLIASDWENRTQGLWVSPRCPKLADNAPPLSGDSPTKFKSSLLRYLTYYEVSAVQQFTYAISCCDMSAVNVFFVSSVPGSHKNADIYQWGHRALSKILRQHVPEEAKKWSVKIQCSSIGSLGQTPDVWLENELGRSLSCYSGGGAAGALPSPGKVELIYPSHEDVLNSYDGVLGGGCLPYSRQTHTKQPWLWDHMYRWKAEASLRTRAMPHIKTYTRVDPDRKKMAYFLLTSANLSKAAWGNMNKQGNSCLIMSYEAGVLFLPKFVTGEDFFSITEFKNWDGQGFPLHYDLPLTKYADPQKPWLYDYLLQ